MNIINLMRLHTTCHLTSFHHDFNSLITDDLWGCLLQDTLIFSINCVTWDYVIFISYALECTFMHANQITNQQPYSILRYRLPYKANVKFPYEPFPGAKMRQMDALLKCIMMSLDIPHDSLSFCLSVPDHSDQQFLRSVPAAAHSSRRSDLDSHLCHLHKHQLCQHQGPQLTVGEHECYW